MAYGAATDNNSGVYRMVLQNTPTGVKAELTCSFGAVNASMPSIATQDQLFQALLTQIAAIPNTTIVSATKTGGYNQTVTA